MKFLRRFFKRIFRNILQDHHLDIEVRCLHPSRDEESFWPKQFWCKSLVELQKHWPEIKELNLKGYNIHFTVIARRRKFQGKKEHPLPDKPIVSCVWADLDVGEDKPYKSIHKAMRAVQKLKPLPNMIVESGTGIHAYWFLEHSREVSQKRFEKLLRSLTRLLKGDKGAARAGRLMRAPNTINWKPEAERKYVTVRYLSKSGHLLRDLESAWKVNSDHSHDMEQHSGKKEKRGLAGTCADFFTEHVKNLKPVGKKFEALGLCPFHDDEQPSFCVNLETGLWKCQSSKCDAEGNVRQFCTRIGISVPASAIKRFPRPLVIPREEEWPTEKVFETALNYVTSQVYFTQSWQPVVVTLWAMGTYLHRNFPCYGHIWLNSPTTHSGKTKLLDVLSTLCYKAMLSCRVPTSPRFPQSLGSRSNSRVCR